MARKKTPAPPKNDFTAEDEIICFYTYISYEEVIIMEHFESVFHFFKIILTIKHSINSCQTLFIFIILCNLLQNFSSIYLFFNIVDVKIIYKKTST